MLMNKQNPIRARAATEIRYFSDRLLETVHNLGGLMRHGETGDGPIVQRSCDPC